MVIAELASDTVGTRGVQALEKFGIVVNGEVFVAEHALGHTAFDFAVLVVLGRALGLLDLLGLLIVLVGVHGAGRVVGGDIGDRCLLLQLLRGLLLHGRVEGRVDEAVTPLAIVGCLIHGRNSA